MMKPTACINSRPVDIRSGDTILSAAKRLGIDIPSPCHAPGLPPPESCRLCLVHSEHHHDRLLAACHTPLEPGMDLQTHHVKVEKWRASLLALHLETAAHTGFSHSHTRPGAWRDLFSRYRVEAVSLKSPGAPLMPERARDDSHPMVRFDPAACVSCRLCVAACDSAAHRFALQIHGRNRSARVAPLADRPLIDTPCTACGSCIEHCPTGALQDRRPAVDPDLEVSSVESICGYCSVGCRIRVESAGEDIVRITGVADRTATNPGGLLCQKGRHGFLYHQSWDRLTRPMIRHGAGFRLATWAEALDHIESRWRAIAAEHGPGAFGAIASTRATTEANYLLQKLCRSVIGSPHIDSSARLCHPPRSAPGTATFADIDRAACIVIAGADPDTSHPVVAARIRRAAAAGAALVVVDPRRTELADFADRHLRPRPGTDADRLLFLALTEALTSQAMESACARAIDAGFSGTDFEDAAELLGRHRGGTLFLAGTGLTQRPGGAATLAAYHDLARLSGNLEGPGSGFLPLGGQNNLTGCLEAGCAPEILPGQFAIDDLEARTRIEAAWGSTLPVDPGLSAAGMIAAAAAGEIRALWVMGHDATHAQAGTERTDAALKKLDLLVVQDPFFTEVSRHAHVLLPAASPFEQGGVVFNAERRAQLVRAALPPAEEARPDWAILTVVARRLGVEWPYQETAQVFAEFASLTPERFGSLSHQRLDESPEGIRCPAPKAAEIFSSIADPLVNSEFPFALITGRKIEHHNTGSMSRRNSARRVSDRDRVALHPADAQSLGISAGDRVAIESRFGKTSAEAAVSDRLLPGVVFLTFHFPQTGANRLISPPEDARDTPSFKATRVRIAKIEP